jgi:hypothetical protein
MMLSRIGGIALAICLSSYGPAVRADYFFLSSGGRIEGRLLNPDESPRKTYELETTFGGRVVLADEQVERVVVKSEAERRYEEFLPSVADTAEGHWDVARRCGEAGLKELREHHLEQVIRHDPEHGEARRALGYSRIDGKWVRQQDWMEKHGYVRHGGGWRLPQEILLEEAADAEEEQRVEWYKKIRMWSGWILRNRGRGAEGEAGLREIRDPSALAALADQLRDNEHPEPLRMLYVDIIGQLGGPAAEAALTQVALEDADPQIRERCLDHLARWQSRFAVAAFVKTLQHDKNLAVRRAAAGLARLQDPSATLPLIDALITEHKQVVSGPGLSPSFSNQGGGLSVGGGPKVVKHQIKNEEALAALTAMYRGINFQYDKQRWRQWYVQQNIPAPFDLRRGN